MPAPLAVIFPGIFSQHDDRTAVMALRLISQFGFHVLVINNPWSLKTIVDDPRGWKMGDVLTEAQIGLDLVQQHQGILKAAGIDHPTTIVFGFSYGAFLGSIAKTLDMESLKPTLNGPTFLVAPPLRLEHTVRHLDSLMDRFAKDFEDFVGWDFLKFITAFGWSRSISEVMPQERRTKAPGAVAHAGFQRLLSAAVNTMENSNPTGKRPALDDNEGRKIWDKKIRFGWYVDQYAPELWNLYRGEKAGFFPYWVRRLNQATAAKGLPRVDLRILAADDDILNVVDDWKTVPAENLILLRGGSHGAFATTPWFAQFAQKTLLEFREIAYKTNPPDTMKPLEAMNMPLLRFPSME